MWKLKGVELTMSTPNEEISIDNIVIEKDKQGKGLCKMAIQMINALGQSNKRTVRLTIPEGKESLKGLFSRFGYVEGKDNSMYKLPKG